MVKLVPSRRQFLIGTAAVGALGTGAVGWIATDDPVDFIVALIERNLPGATLEPDAARTFATEYMATVEDARRDNILKISKLYRGVGLRGIDAVVGDTEQYQNFRRTTVTAFLIGSDYFDRGRAPETPVAYYGISACTRNPFAEFA